MHVCPALPLLSVCAADVSNKKKFAGASFFQKSKSPTIHIRILLGLGPAEIYEIEKLATLLPVPR